MQGWVYVLVNSSIPGMAKVGRTVRSPVDRVAELSQATGVATPFVLAFDHLFADCCAAEKTIHEELDRRGLRVASNREFFRGPPSDIIRVVLEAADQPVQPSSLLASHSAELLLEAGDKCLHGDGDRLRDDSEAVRFYKLAATRGSLVAHERLGRTYAGIYAVRRDVGARRRAMDILREGVRKGNYYCYAEMATLFASERNVASFDKAWELFFNARKTGPSADAEAGTARFETACCRYIAMSLMLGLQPGYQHQLSGLAPGLIRLLLIELDQVRSNTPARQAVIACLRWVYQALLHDRPVETTLCTRSARTRCRLSRRWAGLRQPGYVRCVDTGQPALCNGS